MTALFSETEPAPAPADAPDPAPRDALLRVNGVRVQFEAMVAVHDVSFELSGGSLLGLIGPNGAGKTTLLRAVAGIGSVTRGDVRVFGESTAGGDPSVLRHVGFTSDTPPMYEELSVRDFLRFVAKGYGIEGGEVDDRIDFWLDKVWLTEKAGQKIKQLSRGMRQRVGIARTLLPNPSVILLDEPAAGLDPAGRVQFRQLLTNLRDQGKALIVSSHILADMDEYCTHIGIMSAGRLVRFGTVGEVSHDTAVGRRRYTMTLARTVGSLALDLRGVPGLAVIDAAGDRATLEYASDPADAAALLAELIARGLPVAAFTPAAAGLEEAYLRTGIRQVD